MNARDPQAPAAELPQDPRHDSDPEETREWLEALQAGVAGAGPGRGLFLIEQLQDQAQQQGMVLATGGGAILNEESRRRLRERGTVVYLRASVSSLLQRTSHDRNRPLLQTADPRARIEALMQERAPLYEEVAHITVETGRPNVQTVVQTILSQLELAGWPVAAATSTNPL